MHKMNLLTITKYTLLALIFITLLVSQVQRNAMAKDLSDEKYQVRLAQKEYDKASQDHQALADSINVLEKRIAQQTEQLNTLKTGLPAKEDRLNKAQKALEEKQLLLDKAWEENKRY